MPSQGYSSDGIHHGLVVSIGFGIEEHMQKNAGNPKKKCKNCEGKGLLKQGDKKVKCQRCNGSGFKS
jgi:DnaJ-class molecular chaperone